MIMKVYVAIFRHKHGDDVAVYSTEEAAENARIAVAGEFWFDDAERPFTGTSEDADYYFDEMWDETFEIRDELVRD